MTKKKEANAAPQMDNIINTHVVQEEMQNISPQFDVNKDKEKLINS